MKTQEGLLKILEVISSKGGVLFTIHQKENYQLLNIPTLSTEDLMLDVTLPLNLQPGDSATITLQDLVDSLGDSMGISTTEIKAGFAIWQLFGRK